MIVDAHVHVFPPAIARDRGLGAARCPHFAQLYARAEARLATVDELLASMDRAGIDRAVIVNFGWSDPGLCVETNDYLLDAAARYPERLTAFCCVQPRAGATAVAAELARCARGGARGVGELMPDGQGYGLLDGEVMAALVEGCRRHDLVLLTHASEPVGPRYPGKGTVTPDVLARFLAAAPGLRVIAAHLGGGLPFYARTRGLPELLATTWFDTAAAHLVYGAETARHMVDLAGPERILFGSDYGLFGQPRAVRFIRELNCDPEATTAMLGGNALRLFAKDKTNQSSVRGAPRLPQS